LIDNCSTHKTAIVTALIENLKVPTMFTAPASYLAASIENFFGALKGVDFKKRLDPEPKDLQIPGIRNLTHSQIIILKISKYIFDFDKNKDAFHIQVATQQLGALFVGKTSVTNFCVSVPDYI